MSNSCDNYVIINVIKAHSFLIYSYINTTAYKYKLKSTVIQIYLIQN